MLQEEATLIAEKLEISDFVASNGWLEKFKQKYSICNKKETMESWNETTGSNARDIWNMDETGCFWRGFLKEPYTPREDGALEGKAKQRLTWGFFVNAEGRRNILLLLSRPSVRDALRTYSRQAGHTYNCSFFANSKAWMNTEIMTTILSNGLCSLSSTNSVRTVFKHHRSVFAKKHHFQITATRCR